MSDYTKHMILPSVLANLQDVFYKKTCQLSTDCGKGPIGTSLLRAIRLAHTKWLIIIYSVHCAIDQANLHVSGKSHPPHPDLCP